MAKMTTGHWVPQNEVQYFDVRFQKSTHNPLQIEYLGRHVNK